MANTASVEIQMKKLLDEVDEQVQKAMDDGIKQVAKETVTKLKAESPKGPDGYANGWRTKKIDKNGVVVHNATHYRLTHLLENSHVIRNGNGTYGRTSPGHGQIVHIAPVEEWASEELPRRIMEGIE